MAKKKSNAGRPTVMTTDVVAKLDQAFALDCTVIEACAYADISRDSFYDYLKRNPAYSDRIDKLRERPVLKARQTIVTNLSQPGVAQWYLARKRKDEFSERTENVTDLTVKEEASPEIKRLADLLNGLHRGTGK